MQGLPRRVLSLWDIVRHYNVWQLARLFELLIEAECLAEMKRHVGQGDTAIPVERVEKVYKPMVSYARQQCELIELQAAIVRCDLFTVALRYPITFTELQNQVIVLREAIQGELCFRRFAFVPTAKATIHDRIAMTWADVWEQFPSVKEDSERAIDCHALGQETACVFHLMRVAERGLHALAKERKVKLPRNRLLEWGQWNDIIQELIKKTDAISNQWRAGPAKDAALEFYRGALGQFQSFKDAYRNHVMHSRANYDEHQAASVLSHVLDFMRLLAAKLGENKTKSIKWGRR